MNADLETLVQRYLDGAIQPDEMARLNALLSDDAEARRDFAELLNLDSTIAATAAGWEPAPTRSLAASSSPTVKHSAAPVRRWPVRLAAFCLALVASAGWWWQAQSVCAVVARDAGAGALQEGVELRRERHRLPMGSVELRTARGARLVIEAPAEFRFESAQRLRMLSGRLSAEVPPAAKGFTVVTSSGHVIDLGTRFGVDVPASGPAEVHVFQGEVIARASGAARKQSLRTGDAVTMNAGASAARELRPSAFIQPDELSGLAAALAAGQRARSESALATLRTDPTLIALLDFESPEALPGTGRAVQGRWPGSRAPEFVRVGDHLKLDLDSGQAWSRLTLAAWVRLDRIDAPYQSLLHTDGWEATNPGQVHWMVNRHSTMRLALRGNAGTEDRDGYPDSLTPVLPELGRWTHLAVVYDADAKTTRFFLNGRFDNESHETIAHPARLGPAQIGNWNRQDRKLSGRVDEMLILGRAMTDAEIHALYEAGNPYR